MLDIAGIAGRDHDALVRHRRHHRHLFRWAQSQVWNGVRPAAVDQCRSPRGQQRGGDGQAAPRRAPPPAAPTPAPPHWERIDRINCCGGRARCAVAGDRGGAAGRPEAAGRGHLQRGHALPRGRRSPARPRALPAVYAHPQHRL